MKVRKVVEQVQGFQAQDGAGVKLVRVLGHENVYNFDPFLMLDSFDSHRPHDYEKDLEPHAQITIDVKEQNTVMIFTLKGAVVAGDILVKEKTAARFGDAVKIEAGDAPVEVMLMSAPPTEEPIAWYGPIVMNSQSEIRTAVEELQKGTFIKQSTAY